MNHLNKQIDDQKKAYKKVEFQNNNLVNTIKEQYTEMGAVTKMIEEKKKESK
jgi:hypothetical protein